MSADGLKAKHMAMVRALVPSLKDTTLDHGLMASSCLVCINGRVVQRTKDSGRMVDDTASVLNIEVNGFTKVNGHKVTREDMVFVLPSCLLPSTKEHGRVACKMAMDQRRTLMVARIKASGSEARDMDTVLDSLLHSVTVISRNKPC